MRVELLNVWSYKARTQRFELIRISYQRFVEKKLVFVVANIGFEIIWKG